MLSLLIWSEVITLSGFCCIINFFIVSKLCFILYCGSRNTTGWERLFQRNFYAAVQKDLFTQQFLTISYLFFCNIVLLLVCTIKEQEVKNLNSFIITTFLWNDVLETKSNQTLTLVLCFVVGLIHSNIYWPFHSK